MKKMGFVKAAGREITVNGKPLLLRGFGLGGWLLPEGYMWKWYTKCDRPRRMEALVRELCGEGGFAPSFWERYDDTYITEKDIALIAAEGYNAVRLPLNARHMDKESTWRRVDDCIAWCKKHGLYVVLDMHGAPGGQTGQNIDDSEHDQPELFQRRECQQELIALWRRIALRYKDEEAVAGYDLLNEPLPEFFGQYHDRVLPLYRELAKAIREVDKNHLLILEGVHWATDFSIFDPLLTQPLDDNCMLQFHRYWCNPDQDSIRDFLEYRDQLNLPLMMGEAGENNLDWYKAAFPLYERMDISWFFWSYKKMDCDNSPISFPMPEGWDRMTGYLDGGEKPGQQEARQIFNGFLDAVAEGRVNEAVFRALKREAPITIPAEHFDQGYSELPRVAGAAYRLGEPVSVLFHDGREGAPNYRRMGGEPQPEEERLCVLLREGERVVYGYCSRSRGFDRVALRVKGDGTVRVKAGALEEAFTVLAPEWEGVVFQAQSPMLEVACLQGMIYLDEIEIGACMEA